jgi:hypothetical protein
MHEPLDKICGNPHSLDTHDEVLQQFYLPNFTELPASHPAGYMHLLDQASYLADSDTIIRTVLPRLAEAVATVLYLTVPQCLSNFLNPSVKIFKWRRNWNCLMIRQSGNDVTLGTYHNYGTCFIWTYFVQSRIDDTRAWIETCAGTAQICTPISARGVEFEDMRESEGREVCVAYGAGVGEVFASVVGVGLAEVVCEVGGGWEGGGCY